MYPKHKLRRYHKSVWMPNYAVGMVREFIEQLPFVDITDHASKEMYNDKFGRIPLPTKNELFNKGNELVEIFERILNGVPTSVAQKLVIRVKILNNKYDYTYVIAREGFIVTSWSTEKSDIHKLTKSLYEYYVPPAEREKIYRKFNA